jgi:hypothetical protein
MEASSFVGEDMFAGGPLYIGVFSLNQHNVQRRR